MKTRTLNELRQEKEFGYKHPVSQKTTNKILIWQKLTKQSRIWQMNIQTTLTLVVKREHF